MLKFVPAAILLVLALMCLVASRGGDNADARALAGILLLPAIFFAVVAAVLGLVAWWL